MEIGIPDPFLKRYVRATSKVRAVLGVNSSIKQIFAVYFDEFPPFDGPRLLEAMARRTHYARAWSLFLEDYPLVLTPFLPQPFFRPDRDAEGAEGVREALGSAIWSYSMNFMGLPAGNLPTRLAKLPQAGPACPGRPGA